MCSNMWTEAYSKKTKRLLCWWCASKSKPLLIKSLPQILESSLNLELLWMPKMKDINPNLGYRINNGSIFWLYRDIPSDLKTSRWLYLGNYPTPYRKMKDNGKLGSKRMTLKITPSQISLKELHKKKKSVPSLPLVWSERLEKIDRELLLSNILETH